MRSTQVRHLTLILLSALCGLCGAARADEGRPPEWKAAAGSVVITPERSMWMAGYAARDKPSEGTAQDLFAKAGIEIEIKSVTASVYFSSDPANWDTFPHFATDIQMYTTTMTQPDPQRFMDQFTSWEVASKDNKWQGRNPTRWRSEEYDKTWRAAEAEMDPVKRAALFIKMNDLVIQNGVVIPVVWRPRVAVVSSRLKGAEQSGWDSDFWNLPNWHRG